MTQDPTQQGREAFEKWENENIVRVLYHSGIAEKICDALTFEKFKDGIGIAESTHGLKQFAYEIWKARQPEIEALNKRVEELEGTLQGAEALLSDAVKSKLPTAEKLTLEALRLLQAKLATPVASHE